MEVKRSKWNGLWNNSEEHYMISQPIDIESLKDFTESDSFRLIIKKYKYYEKGGNKPYYCFAIGNVYASATNKITSKNLQYSDYNELEEIENSTEMAEYIRKNFGIKLYTIDEVKKVMWGANEDGYNHFTDIMIEDYI